MSEAAGAAEDATVQALSLKDEGNVAFKAGQYDAAVEAYTKALELDGQQHLCYSNRSAAYLKLGCEANLAGAKKSELLEKALADAVKCVELNPTWSKGYSRQAAALQELKLWDEAVDACKKGLDLSKDAALEKMHSEVMTRHLQSQLLGSWIGTVHQDIGGYEQAMEFLDDSRVRVTVLGKSLLGMYWVDASPQPHHLNIQVPVHEAPPGMPQPPPVQYIVRIDNGLHICCPFMTPERPTEFGGPGYCLMQRGELKKDEDGAEVADLSPEQRLRECAKALIKVLPDDKIEELSQTDSEEATNQKLLATVRFESSMYVVQKKFGEEVIKQVLEATKSSVVPPGLAGTSELKELHAKLTRCGMLEAGEAPESSQATTSSKRKVEERKVPEADREPEPVPASSADSAAEKAHKQESCPEAQVAAESYGISQVGCAVSLAAAAALVALLWWRRRQAR